MRERLRLASAALWLLHGAAAAGEPVRFRMPDGSSGIASDAAHVPPGAQLTGGPAGAPAGALPPPLPVDDGAELQESAREAAKAQRAKAEGTPCVSHYDPQRRRASIDCSARAAERRRAAALERALRGD